MTELVNLPVTGRTADAELIASRLRHEGIEASVSQQTYVETGSTFSFGTCLLLVEKKKAERAIELIDALDYSDNEPDSPEKAARVAAARRKRIIMTWIFVFFAVILPFFVGLFWFATAG